MMPDLPIYLDYNATTPAAESVVEAMLPWFTRTFGNSASAHVHGQLAAAAVQDARGAVADSLGVSTNSLVFTSGATEANNLVIRGLAGRVVVPASEHKAVLETAQARDHMLVPVDERGSVDLDALDRAAQGAVLISVMWANNETGVIQDLAPVVEIARRHGCLVHTDATQAFGKLDVDLGRLDIDLASVSAHKVHGPKGIGALYLRRGVVLDSIMTGGGHERGLRSGTLNVPGIVGFGAAAQRLQPSVQAGISQSLLDRLVSGLDSIRPFECFSDHYTGLPNTLSIRFPGADADAVIANAPEICISTGSACTAAVPEPSHVLAAMGVEPVHAFEALRISVGEPTTPNDIDRAAEALREAVERVRSLNPDMTVEAGR